MTVRLDCRPRRHEEHQPRRTRSSPLRNGALFNTKGKMPSYAVFTVLVPTDSGSDSPTNGPLPWAGARHENRCTATTDLTTFQGKVANDGEEAGVIKREVTFIRQGDLDRTQLRVAHLVGHC